MIVKMKKHKSLFKNWVEYNTQQILANLPERSSSGHIDDILKLPSMTKSEMLDLSIGLFKSLNSLESDSLYKNSLNLMLYIFLADSNAKIIPQIKNQADVIKLMDETPPEFCIRKKTFDDFGTALNKNVFQLGNYSSCFISVAKYPDNTKYNRLITLLYT
jgi:hypothetical protein